MNVLIGCEYSGTVRDEFNKLGHFAMSCDILPTESPGPHYTGDIYEAMELMQWDLMILHPPCTFMSVSGNRHYGEGKDKHYKRLNAVAWTEKLWRRAKLLCPLVAIENPVGTMNTYGDFPKPQYVQPYEFGHMETKKTGLWLHGLPPLTETNNVKEEMDKLPRKEKNKIHFMSPGPERGKLRSKFYSGVAQAMALQWGGIVNLTEVA